MNPLYYQLASAACAGAATALLGATHYYGGRLLKHDREVKDLRDVIASQRQRISSYMIQLNSTYGKLVFTPTQETEMCGGCGAYLSQEEIATCPGVSCIRYQNATMRTLSDEMLDYIANINASEIEGQLPLFDPLRDNRPRRRTNAAWGSDPLCEATADEVRKLNIGYTGHLHTTKKPLK